MQGGLREGRKRNSRIGRVIETVSGWTDLKRGVAVSVALWRRTKNNVIAAQAWAEVDLRIVRKADGRA